jgi:hypothetical protein
MKAVYPVLFFVAVILSACQPKTENLAADPEKAKAELLSTLDTLYHAFNTRDINLMSPILADSGLHCGTDPGEFWDRNTYVKLLGEMFSDTSYVPELKIDKREIQMSKDGKSAIVVDQFYSFFIKTIPVRQVFHFIKTDKGWVFDFSSIGLIPDNAELKMINAATE